MESADILMPSCMVTPLSDPVEHFCPPPIQSQPVTITKKLCPWGKVISAEPVSLNDVMSEELAKSLQQEEEDLVKSDNSFVEESSGFPVAEDPDCKNDLLLAQMLQLEFDKEHDNVLKLEEKKYNGTSKVSVSFDKYLRLPDSHFSDDDDDDDMLEEINTKRHWDNFEQAQKAFNSVGKSGISRQGNTITTKHDPTLCGRRNACKVMELPPGISTGDGGGFDMKLSNNVYNQLKLHSIAEDKRAHRLHDKKEKSTAEKAVDTTTRLILYKLVNNQTLESVNGCISTGKEACVFHAWSGQSENEVSVEYAIKVFKTTLNEFQNRDQYIKDDHRFRDRFSKLNPRKVIHMWAEKEMRNLSRITKAKIPCPEVISLRKHVLVMSFIGKDMNPAPKLKDVKLPLQDMSLIYEQTLDIMRKMYKECHLVHADFSEYNLLWFNDRVWVIDVSQSVEITHPLALEFLIRDCNNILSFFRKQGLKNIPKPQELFTDICGLQLPQEQLEALASRTFFDVRNGSTIWW